MHATTKSAPAGASAALLAIDLATARKRGQPLDRNQQWALALAERKGRRPPAFSSTAV